MSKAKQGRPPLPQKDRNHNEIMIRISDSTLLKYEKLARKMKKPLRAYIRGVLEDALLIESMMSFFVKDPKEVSTDKDKKSLKVINNKVLAK